MLSTFRRVVCGTMVWPMLLAPLALYAQGSGNVTLEQVARAIQELDGMAQKEIRESVPGLAIAVIFQDKIEYAKGFGVRDVKTRAPVDANTVFQLASLSKPIGSTVVARLVGEDKITWDSRLSLLDPTFAMFDPWVTREITIRDMYAHRSGLPEHAGDLLEDLGFGREEILHRLRYQHPASSFRSDYAYTNFGLTEAGVAAAKAYGLAWEDASEEKLYKPLGMTSSSSRYTAFMARPNKALGHVLVEGKWVQKFKRDPDPESPAGGVSSSVNDLAQWMRLQLGNGKLNGKQIVAENALSETHHPQILTGFSPNGLPSFYGLGWNVSYDNGGRLRLNHSGAFALGAATHVNLVPGEQLGIVVLTNAYPIGLAEGLGFTFIDTALYGKPTRDWLAVFKEIFSNPAAMGVFKGFDYSKSPESRSPALKNDSYLGIYRNDFFGEISIVEKGGGLAIIEGPEKKKALPMKHYDHDTFTYETEGENAVGASGIIFTIGPDGKASDVLVENLNVRGEGAFKRVLQQH